MKKLYLHQILNLYDMDKKLNKAIKILIIILLSGWFIILLPKIIHAILDVLGISIGGY